MNMQAKLLWGSWVVVCAMVLVFWLMGCSQQTKAETAKLSTEAVTCRAKISALIQASPSCGVAAAAVRQLIKEDPACIDIFLGHDAELNCKDGGAQ